MTPRQQQIIDAARSCIGTPFRHQGRCPGRGIDCAGVVVFVASQLGFAVRDVRGYHRTPHKGRLQKALEENPFLTQVAEPQPGDVLLLRIRHDPQHLAIYAGDSIVHSYETVGRVLEERFSDFWRARIVAIYRFAE
jgi:cell wall-associated NlpC family hydrolase